MSQQSAHWPELTFPKEEADRLRTLYEQAQVILEYGSGGSTMLAATLGQKLIFSVESDRDWAIRLQTKLDQEGISPAIVYHVDIGKTGSYGRAIDDRSWRTFHRYPISIWSEPFFRQPDLLLIDGRFRPACLLNACLSTKAPLKVLFDDYTNRPKYHVVEKVIKPSKIHGRMAEFDIEPRAEWPSLAKDMLIELCTKASFAATHVSYELDED
jgi:hypothetical protein